MEIRIKFKSVHHKEMLWIADADNIQIKDQFIHIVKSRTILRDKVIAIFDKNNIESIRIDPETSDTRKEKC